MAQSDHYWIGKCSATECNGFYEACGFDYFLNKSSNYRLERLSGKCWIIAIGKTWRYKTDSDAGQPGQCSWFDSITGRIVDIKFSQGPSLNVSPSGPTADVNVTPISSGAMKSGGKFSGFNTPAGTHATPMMSRMRAAARFPNSPDSEGKEDLSAGEEEPSAPVRPAVPRRGAKPYRPADAQSDSAGGNQVNDAPVTTPQETGPASTASAVGNGDVPVQQKVEDAPKNDLFQNVQPIPSTTPSTDSDSDRNVDNMMVQTMYKMVEDIEIVVDGCTFQKKVLFLTNKQCNLFKPEGFLRCLKALEVGKPKCVIRLLAADHGVAYYEVHEEQEGQIFAPHRYASDLDAHDAGECRTRLDQFMETCILPLAKRTHALIICSGCNDSELTASLERVVVPEQARLGEECPFKVLTFLWTYEVHYNASRNDESVARKVAGRCKAWCERFVAISKHMSKLSARDVQRCDLTNAASHVVVFDPIEDGVSERGPSLAFQAKLTDALTKQVPSFAIQVLECDYKDTADLSRRGIPILFLDSRERSSTSWMETQGALVTNLAKRTLNKAASQTILERMQDLDGVRTQTDIDPFVLEENLGSATDSGAAAVPANPPGEISGELTGVDSVCSQQGQREQSVAPSAGDGETRSSKKALPSDLTEAVSGDSSSEWTKGQLLLKRAFRVVETQMDELAESGVIDYDNSSAVALIHSALKFGIDPSDTEHASKPLYARIQELKRVEQDSGSTSASALISAELLREAAQFFVLKMRTCVARQKLEKVTRFLAKGEDGKQELEEEAVAWKQYLEELIAAAEDDGGYSEAGDAEDMLRIQQLLSSPITFSGSLFDLDDLCRTVLSIVKIDRLPKENSLEALLSLQDAWDHVDAYHRFANFYKIMTKVSYFVLILAGLATCVIAVQRVGRAIGSPSDQYVILAISLVSTAVAAYVNFMNPAQLWQQLRGAAISMESQIWMFRTRAGDYCVSGASDADSSHADALLQERILAIKKEVLESGYIKRTAFFGRLSNLGLRQKNGSRLFSGRCIPTSAIWCCIMKLLAFCIRPASGSAHGTGSVSNDGTYTEAAEDDHYQPVPASSYVEYRIKAMLKFYKKRIPRCNRTRHIAQFLSTAGSLVSVVLAFLDLVEWTVITAIGVAGVFSWLEFQDTINKLERYSSVVDALQNHVIWWETRPHIEKSATENIDKLVVQTEDIQMNELAAWRFSSTTSRKLLENKVAEQKPGGGGSGRGGGAGEVP